MFRKFEIKLTLVFLALFLAVQGLVLTAVYVITDRNVGNQAKRQLMYSGEVLTRNLERQRRQMVGEVQILSSDFGFRSAIASDDAATIASALDNLSSRIDVHHAALIPMGSEKPVVSGLSDTWVLSNEALDGLKDEVEAFGSASTLAVIDDQIHEIVVVPVLAPIPIAWILLSRPFTNQVASEMQNLLDRDIEVSFASKETDGTWSPRASTLEPGASRTLAASLLKRQLPANVPEISILDGTQFVVLSLPLGPDQSRDQFRVIVQYSLQSAFQPYLVLALSLGILSILGFIGLASGSVILARGMAKPLRQLNQAAKRISAGDYHSTVDIEQRDEVGQLASSFNDMVMNIRDREEEITYRASHDVASGLPNLLAFQSHVDRCLIEARNIEAVCGVVVLHIKRLPEIQETFGHDPVEQLIGNIGTRLADLVFEADFIARLTTTSLAIVLPGMNLAQCIAIGQKIDNGFEEPFNILNFNIDVGSSIGLALYPVHGTTTRDLIQHADVAAGQPTAASEAVTVYDEDADRHTAERLSLMTHLKAGLENDEVFFAYQPKINLETGAITHVEALVRWIHPEQGFISPEDFIPLAEQTGHIHLLTEWALKTAIGQCGRWRRNNIDLTVAINLSACDLMNKNLPMTIERLLEEHDVKPEWIVLEVTESAIMADASLALEILRCLNDMGHVLSIDDFGTGHSSMAYLKQLPVQELKIDKSFVLGLASNKEDEVIVQSTIELASRLGLKVTAEGIEDAATVKVLQNLNCQMGQGFFLSKPVSPEEIVTLLNQPGNFLENRTNANTAKKQNDNKAVTNIG